MNNEGTTLHLSGNVMEGNANITNDNWKGVSTFNNADIKWTKCENISDGYTDSEGNLWSNDQYINDYPVTTQTAYEAYDTVLENAGASYVRDNTDKRVVDNVRNSTVPYGSKSGEGLIDSQDDVGGWESLYGIKGVDSDNDGIPDEWEESRGLDKNDGSDSIKISEKGYTYIEEYANNIVEGPVCELDKNALKSALEKAESIDRSHYGQETDFAPLDEAMEEAVRLISSRESLQEDIDKCADKILEILSSFTEDEGWRLVEALGEAEK